MAGYVGLFRCTEKGMADIKQLPERIRQTKKAAGRMGITTVGIWLTTGDYDLVGVFDAPDEQTMTTFMLTLEKQGEVRGQLMRAMGEEELPQVVGKMAA